MTHPHLTYFSWMQIEAHVGSVNDLAFSYPNKQLSVVTCGEDRLIKVCLGVPFSISCESSANES